MVDHDPAVIIGVGETEFSVPADGVSGEQLTIAAVQRAAADAGLDPRRIDGICKYSYDGTISDVDLARALRMEDVRFSVEVPHGGGSCCSIVQAAVAAVRSGLATAVVCYRTVAAYQWFRQMASPDRARPYYADAKRYLRPAGLSSYVDLFGLLFSEQAAQYGAQRMHLGTLAVSARQQAMKHDNAVLTDALTLDAYLAEPPTIGQLSFLDDLVQADGSVALIVTSASRAADLPAESVRVLAVAEAGGASVQGYWELAPLRADPLTSAASSVARRLYGASGLTPEEIDVSLLYDCSTVATLQLLQEYSLIPAREPDAVLEEGFGTTTRALNPHGGHLAGGYIHGFSQVAEAVRQVRGVAANQVPEVSVALVGGPPLGVTSGMILGREGVGE